MTTKKLSQISKSRLAKHKQSRKRKPIYLVGGVYETPITNNPSHISPPPIPPKPSHLTPQKPASNKEPSANRPPEVNRKTKPRPAFNGNKPSHSSPPAVRNTATPPKPPRARDYPIVTIVSRKNALNEYTAYEESIDSRRVKIRSFYYKPIKTTLETCDKSVPFAIIETEYGNYLCSLGKTYEYNAQISGYELYNTDFEKLGFNIKDNAN